MTIFPAITFFHIVGAITLFISWALEYNYLTSKTQFTDEEVTASNQLKNYAKLAGIAVFIILGTGIWLMVAFGQYASWMIMALVSIFLIKITDVLFSRKVSSIKTQKSREMYYRVSSIRLRIAIGIGIIALMVFKPSDLLSSLFFVLISVLAGMGVIWVLPPLKRNVI